MDIGGVFLCEKFILQILYAIYNLSACQYKETGANICEKYKVYIFIKFIQLRNRMIQIDKEIKLGAKYIFEIYLSKENLTNIWNINMNHYNV